MPDKKSAPYVLPNGIVVDLLRVEDVRFFASRRPQEGHAFRPCVDVKLEPETPYPYNTIRCMFRTEQGAIDAAKAISEAVERAQSAESRIGLPSEVWMLQYTQPSSDAKNDDWVRLFTYFGPSHPAFFSEAEAICFAMAFANGQADCKPVRVK